MDNLVEQRLERAAGETRERFEGLRGKVALANAKLAHQFIGPATANTMPRATMDAFRDHGEPRMDRIALHVSRRTRMCGATPHDRPSSDVVEAIHYLESASFVTGEILQVDGGQSAGH